MINRASVQLWGLMAVFRRQGEGTWEKFSLPKVIADPAAGLGPIVPMIGPIVSMIGP